MTIHVGIDIETFGIGCDAAIASIGACKFKIQEEFEVLETFYHNVDQKSNKSINRVYNKDTLAWWAKQKKEVQEALMVDQQPIQDVLSLLSDFVRHDNQIWAYGVSFDIPIIESSYSALGVKDMPWDYTKFRCVRTLSSVFGIPVDRSGSHHNALSDAIDQSKLVNTIMWELEKMKS